MDKEKELNELIALYAMRTRINNDQKRGEELLRLFIKEYEQVKSVDLAQVGGNEVSVCKCKGGPMGRVVSVDFEHQICTRCGMQAN